MVLGTDEIKIQQEMLFDVAYSTIAALSQAVSLSTPM